MTRKRKTTVLHLPKLCWVPVEKAHAQEKASAGSTCFRVERSQTLQTNHGRGTGSCRLVGNGTWSRQLPVRAACPGVRRRFVVVPRWCPVDCEKSRGCVAALHQCDLESEESGPTEVPSYWPRQSATEQFDSSHTSLNEYSISASGESRANESYSCRWHEGHPDACLNHRGYWLCNTANPMWNVFVMGIDGLTPHLRRGDTNRCC